MEELPALAVDIFLILPLVTPAESVCQPTGADLVYLLSQFSKLELNITGWANDKKAEEAMTISKSVFFMVLFKDSNVFLI